MNKGFKVLSSVLAMSMVLASGVFAENDAKSQDWNDQTLGVLKEYLGDGRMDVTKKVEVSSVYEGLVTKEFKKDLGLYDDAFKALEKDVDMVRKLGDARCEAQFELDSANNELMAGRMLLNLAKGIKKVKRPDAANEGFVLKRLNQNGLLEDVPNNELTNLFGRALFKADAEKLEALVKANKELQDGYDKVEVLSNLLAGIDDKYKEAAVKTTPDNKFKSEFINEYNELMSPKENEKLNDQSQFDGDKLKKFVEKLKKVTTEKLAQAKDTFAGDEGKLGFGILDGKSKKSKFEDNVKALKALNDNIGNPGAKYDSAVSKVATDYKDEYTATLTQGKLDGKAKLAAGKIHIIETFAKKHGFTLRACTLADYTAKASDKAASAEDKKNAKKDDVPNTDAYFMIYVPTCQLSAPAVKYYGAAQVYDKVLRRPLVCKNVKEEIVKVPMFTFDQITAYDVACCCCK